MESPDREQRGGDGGTTFPTVITDFIFTEFNNVNFTEFLTSTFFQIPTSISYQEFPPFASITVPPEDRPLKPWTVEYIDVNILGRCARPPRFGPSVWPGMRPPAGEAPVPPHQRERERESSFSKTSSNKTGSLI